MGMENIGMKNNMGMKNKKRKTKKTKEPAEERKHYTKDQIYLLRRELGEYLHANSSVFTSEAARKFLEKHGDRFPGRSHRDILFKVASLKKAEAKNKK